MLDRATVAAVDSTGQMSEVLDLATHLRDAVWRVESSGAGADGRSYDAPGGLIVAGMGGSATGGRLALGALGDRLTRPLAIADGYALPGWAGPQTLVLCSSYSGNTEETLSCYDDAVERGAPRIVASTGGELVERARHQRVPVIPIPGGFQPRAAVGYALVSVLEAAALAGAAPSLHAEIEAAASLAEALAAEWGPDGPEDGEAKTIARGLEGTIPVIGGAELAAAAAYRWKCQINENSSLPAFSFVLPEAGHNEIVGWEAARALGRFGFVLLDDPGAHPRNRLRTELTAGIVKAAGDVVLVRARGETRLERLVSLVLLGDLVSIYLAVLRGQDPVEIETLDALKAELARR
jgi:glucose/mannose-6-phosphate isomerase